MKIKKATILNENGEEKILNNVNLEFRISSIEEKQVGNELSDINVTMDAINENLVALNKLLLTVTNILVENNKNGKI